MDRILSTIMAGSGEVLGEAIGLAIVAALMIVGVLPIYFIMKKISGSKTIFAEDLREYFTARPQPRPETLGMLCPRQPKNERVLVELKDDRFN